MERRHFIKAGLASGVAGAGMLSTTSCVSTWSKAGFHERMQGLEMDAYLASVDERMNNINRFACREGCDDAETDPAARRAVRMLSLSSLFRELPSRGSSTRACSAGCGGAWTHY